MKTVCSFLILVVAAYHDVLKAAGVDVSMKIIKGVPHAFWGWPGNDYKCFHILVHNKWYPDTPPPPGQT